MKELIADAGQSAPDPRLELVDIAADEDVVFMHWQATGTHEEQHKVNKYVRDVEPTGEEWSASGVIIYRIEQGKLVEGWHYHNVLEYALERGMAGAPGGNS